MSATIVPDTLGTRDHAPKAKRVLPDEVKPLDLIIRAQMKAQSAPEYVLSAWDGFLDALSKWEGEKARAKGKLK